MATSLIDAVTAGQSYRAREQAIRGNELQLQAEQRAQEQRPMESRLAQIALGQRQGVAPGTPGMKAEPQSQQSALMELVALNPELGAQVQEAGLKLAADERTQAENQAKALGAFVMALDQLPEDQRAGARDMFLQTPVAQAVIGNPIMAALAQQTDFSDAVIKPRAAQARAVFGSGEAPSYEFVTNDKGERVAIDRRDPTRVVPTGVRERERTPLVQMSNFGNAAAPVPATRSTQNSLQSSIVAGDAMISNLNAIEKDFDPKFLQVFGGQGTLAQWIARARDRSGVSPLSAAQAASLAKFTALRTRTERAFNAYRKEITGAAAALQELDRLKKSFLNTDMSPTEFRTALTDYRDELLRVRRLYMDLMRQGFTDFGEGGDGARALDEAYLSGADADGSARASELRAAGFSNEDIADKLEAEGYN